MSAKTAVLFDFGNVLVRLDFERALRRLRALAPRTPATAEAAAFFFSENALALNRGQMSGPLFLGVLAAQLDVPADRVEELADIWCDIFLPWPEMEALADACVEGGSPVYLLSNTDPMHMARLRPRIPVLERFSGLHLSYEVGKLKPDPTFFTHALTRFGLQAERCAFVDDRPDNCDAARSVGIPSFLHEGDPEAVRAFLVEQGVRLGGRTAPRSRRP